MSKRALLLLMLVFIASGSAYAQIPTGGLRFWLRASDITGANGDSIGTWPDNSGNGRAASSTGSFRPTLVTNAINGLPTVRFNGDGGTTKNQPLMVVQDSTVGTVNVFIVLAHQRDPLVADPGQAVDVVMAGKTDFPSRGFGFSTYNTFANRGNREIRREGGINEGTDGNVTIRKNGFAISATLNLGEYAIIQYDANGFSNTGGSGFPFVLGALRDSLRAGKNDIAEVIVYNRSLTTEEREQVENYLSGRYDIPISLPAVATNQIPTTGLQVWLRPEELGNSGFNRGDAVTTWIDVSGKGRTAKSTGSASPTLFNGAVNGYPSVRFDGVNDTMGFALPTSGAITAFAVAASRAANLANPNVLMASTADVQGTTNGFGMWLSGGGNRQLLAAGTGGTAATLRKNGTGTLSLNQNEFAIATYTGTVTNSAGSGVRTRLASALNGTGAGEVEIAEVLVYNRILTQQEIETVERYLSLKFNIGVPANVAQTALVLDDFSVSDTTLNGWTVGIPAGDQPFRDRYTLAWQTDLGQPALKVGVSGSIGVNGLPQGRRRLPGDLADTLGGGGDSFWKTIKANANDTTSVNLSRAKVIHVWARTETENLNAFGRDIAPTLRVVLRDTSLRATNGGRRFSNEIAREATLIADGKYREYIFDFNNNFVGLNYDDVFGFGATAVYSVDSTQIDQVIMTVNPGLIYGMTFRHNFDDTDREARVVGNRGPDNVGGDYVPVYTTSAPRFRGDIFIRKIEANDSPLPTSPKSTATSPTVAAGEAGEGAYVLGNTGAFIEIQRNGTSSGTITTTRGVNATVDTVDVIDTVGFGNVYRINDGDAAPHIVIPGRIWTINQTGLGAETRFDISLDVSGLTNIPRPQNLYIARRANSSVSRWTPVSTYRSGNFLKAFNLSAAELGQFGIATKTNRNPTAALLNTPRKEAGRPTGYELAQNYPNPFNPATTIRYSVPSVENVSLKIYDVLGREVATLVNTRQTAGNYSVTFNAANLSSGVYFYRLQTGSFSTTRKMMLIK
ncbi:MAG: T9SS type A sorting domain-containing protein [Chloroherpetonaceae bacterium]|nr:T9SS type A sorting domain-containing protein [Chloroherpetonaceae bacterium]